MPIYPVTCPVCGDYERILPMMSRHDPCKTCGSVVEIRIVAGTAPSKGFEPYYDVGLGKYIETAGDRNVAMRKLGADFRQPMSKGDIEARKDRVHEQRRG